MTAPASLSVVVPVYNSAAMLPALMQRLAIVLEGQRPYEVLLVNDGSIDSSWDIITELCRDESPGSRNQPDAELRTAQCDAGRGSRRAQ